MNREIKFRVWDKTSNAFIEDGVLIDQYGKTYIWYFEKNNQSYPMVQLTDEFIIQQYVGLKDKNSKDIYEGDILCMPDDEPPEYGNALLVVEYRGAGFVYKDLFKKTDIDSIHGLIGLAEKDEEVGIVGNIFENPELLK